MSTPINDNSHKNLAPEATNTFRARMQAQPFPQGQKHDQLLALHNQLVDMIDIVLGEQNRKLLAVSQALADKAGRDQVEALGESLTKKVEGLLQEIRNRVSEVDHHHDDHPTTPPTVLEMVAAGTAQLDASLEYSENALVMCVLRDGGLSLYDVLRDENGLPRYEPFNQDTDERQLAQAVLHTHQTGQFKPGQLVYITVNLITSEPLDETSFRVPASTQS